MKPKRFKSALACLAILLVVLAWFSPWWAADKVLAPLDLQNLMMSPWRGGNETEFAKNHIVSDGVDQYLVYRLIAARDYRQEGWVGWSSLTYGGTAQYANTMALYFDWTMQLHRWLDFWKAWHLGLIGQVLLAAFGMFLFLRGRDIGQHWACCGALAYAANSQFVTWIFHRWALSSFCWVPWILWAIDGYRKGRRGTWAAVPLFIAMAFLGGTLQHCALVVLTVSAMWLDEALQHQVKSKNQNPKSIITGQWPILGRYAAWGVLAAGLAAMMLLPCTDAFLTSNRLGLHMGMTVNAKNSIYPHGPLQPLFNLAAYPLQIFPSLLGRCDSVDVLKLFKSELLYVVYFGSLPVLIGYLAFWSKDSPFLARVLTGYGLLLPLTPLVRILYQRLFLLFIFGGILAFVHFMEHSARKTRMMVFRITASLGAIGAATWTGLSLFLLFKSGLLVPLREKILDGGRESSFGFFGEWIVGRADRFLSDLFIWSPQQFFPLCLFAAALAGLKWTASEQAGWRTKGALLLAMAVICEVTLFGSRWVAWIDPSQHKLFPATPESDALLSHVAHDERVSTLIHPTAHMARTPFIPNTLSAYGIAADNGYDSIIPNGMLLPGQYAGDARKLGRLGVSHLITWPGNPNVEPNWKLVWKSATMELYDNLLAMPKYAGFLSNQDKELFFAGKSPGCIKLTEELGLENRRVLNIPQGVAWIRIAENQAAGWEYRVGSSNIWMPVERGMDDSMVIKNPLPAQATRIEMRYDPPLRKLGFLVSVMSLILVVICQLLITRRARAGTQHRPSIGAGKIC